MISDIEAPFGRSLCGSTRAAYLHDMERGIESIGEKVPLLTRLIPQSGESDGVRKQTESPIFTYRKDGPCPMNPVKGGGGDGTEGAKTVRRQGDKHRCEVRGPVVEL